jgi:hypothetical protein
MTQVLNFRTPLVDVTAWLAGRGTAVFVEGDTARDDPWIYGRWFGGRATEISFFPQNGWHTVSEAVRQMRAQGHRVAGIVDRDFTKSGQPNVPLCDGVHVLDSYCIENYLLDENGWFELLLRHHRGVLPSGWQSPVEVAEQREKVARELIPVVAHNAVVYREACRLPADAPQRAYITDPRAVNLDALAEWGVRRGASDLAAQYDAEVGKLHANPERWRQDINGKLLIRRLWNALPWRGGKPTVEDGISRYLDVCPNPPEGLVGLLEALSPGP